MITAICHTGRNIKQTKYVKMEAIVIAKYQSRILAHQNERIVKKKAMEEAMYQSRNNNH